MSVSVNQDRVNFTVKGRSTPWARAGRKGGFSYTPQHVRKFQDFVKKCAADAMDDRTPLLGPLEVGILFYLPVSDSWPAWKKEAAIEGMVHPTSRPDLDNLAKAIEDACNLVVWKDDSQVVTLKTTKLYGVAPQAQVTVTPIPHISSHTAWKNFLRRRAHVPIEGPDLFAAA